jgi:hypothetical protein
VESSQAIKGTSVNIRFDAAVGNILEAVLHHGFPQHYSIVYEDIETGIKEFARQLGIELIIPQATEI